MNDFPAARIHSTHDQGGDRVDITPPYLILHKVRGSPAFDIAIRMRIGQEDGWIIPTSGHRAYPLRKWRLSELNPEFCTWTDGGIHVSIGGQDFNSHPDHYPCNDQKRAPSPNETLSIEDIGL